MPPQRPEREIVIVLGSKPGARLPAVRATHVLAVNSAVEIGLEYRKRYGSRVIAVVNGGVLRETGYIQDSLRTSQPDEVVVVGGDVRELPEFIRTDLGVADAQIHTLTNYERYRLMRETLGMQTMLVIAAHMRLRGARYVLTHALPDILGARDMRWMSRSTGIDAIMYCMRRFAGREIVAAGIGLTGGAHFTGKGGFTEKTAIGDRITMRHWPRVERERLATTDDTLSMLGDVPLWRGDTFSF